MLTTRCRDGVRVGAFLWLRHEKGGCPARPCSPMHPQVLDRTLRMAMDLGKSHHNQFGFVAPDTYGQATRAAPRPISTTPSHPRRLSSSPSTSTPSTATSTTLSLSIGATRETGPSFRAWK